jgi:hypothetical protein
MGRETGVGQEVARSIGGMGRQPFRDVLEIGDRVDLMTPA